MFNSAVIGQRNIIYTRGFAPPQALTCRKVIVFLLILFIIIFSIIYIIQANAAATEGYKIQNYESEILKLRSANKKLNLKLSEIQSFEYLAERIKTLNMVKMSRAEIEYLSPVSQVAAR